MVKADQHYVRRVLRNLLSNAFKYTPVGTPIAIEATLHEENIPGQVSISVQDAGPGIPPAELPLLFQKFVRLKRDLSGTVRGTGLGLYISKQLVEVMGGRIWVESSGVPGEGSRFCFTLPVSMPANRDRQSRKVYPSHFQSFITSDISHSWQSIHSEWDTGKMDGFYTTDGNNAMGYYNGSDLSYYYWLAKNFTLCGNYFCYQLGPTTPNRLAFWTATCGGNTTNNINGGQLNWPTIADLLDQHKIS